MKTFAITIATITGLLAHQAVAADTMIDIEWEDNSHFKLQETSSDVISKCAYQGEGGFLSRSHNAIMF